MALVGWQADREPGPEEDRKQVTLGLEVCSVLVSGIGERLQAYEVLSPIL